MRHAGFFQQYKAKEVYHGEIRYDQYDSIRLENQFCFPLYVCAKEVVRLYRKPLASLDLTYTQHIVMMVLWEFGGMTEGEPGRRTKPFTTWKG